MGTKATWFIIKEDDHPSAREVAVAGPFHNAKIPFIYFGVEDHTDYHKPTDVFENIDAAFYADVVNFIIDAINEFDRGM